MATDAERARLGAEIRRVREQEPMSQAAFAEALGVARETVSRWEHGRLAVTGSTLADIERLCGVRVRLVGLDDSVSIPVANRDV